MFVAPRSVNSTPRKRSSQKRLQRSRRQIEHLPTQAQRLPMWLQGFLFLEQSSAVVTFCAIAATLGMYAWTVYIPQLWTKEYQNLTKLQSHERQLTIINEASKDNLARQAENPRSGLIQPNAQNPPIPLPATTPESTPTPPTPSTSNQKRLPIVKHPLAY